MTRSTLWELIESRIDGSLDDFVKARRPDWHSWNEIATEIEQRTGVVIHEETLRRWFADREKQSESAA